MDSKRIKDVDENVMLSSQLIDTASGIPGTSDVKNVRPRNVFLK